MSALKTRPLHRRAFLRASLQLSLATAGVMGLPAIGRAIGAAPTKGRILGVTLQDPTDPGTEESAVVDLDLATGAVDYHPLPGHKLGHSLVPLPDVGYFAVPYGDDEVSCLILDHAFNVLADIEPPAGYGYAGHAALLPDGRHLFGHFNQAAYNDTRTVDQTGQMFVVDLQERRIVNTRATNVLHGHDIILTRDKRFIVVGDDGTLRMRKGDELTTSDDPFALTPGTPQLVLFDAKSLAEVKKIPLDINGALVHLAEDQAGRIIGAAEQFVANNEAGHKALRELLGQDVEMYVDHLSDALIKLGVELPYPGPLVRVDLETGNMEEHLAPYNQMPFDINMNTVTGRVFHVFTASGMLARFDPLKQSWGYFSTEPYGITQPYSVTEIPGTTMMAVNGFLEGIALFDALTMQLLGKYDTRNFGLKHLQYQEASA